MTGLKVLLTKSVRRSFAARRREDMFAPNQISLDDLPAAPGSRIVRATEVDAWQDGYRFLAAVREAAGKVEENARKTYAAAYAKGYTEGRAAGAIEASRLVRDTTLAVDRYLGKLESEIGALALGVVRRVLGDLDIADVVARAAAQALAEFRQEKFIKVTVHPAAVDRVSTALAALTQGNGATVTVESDPALDQGACIVASDFAVVDASIEAQLRAFATGVRSGGRDLRS
jgi:type III secretion protein L